MAYEKCIDVSEEIWKEFQDREPREISGRTGALYQEGVYQVRFLDRTLLISPVRRQGQVTGAPGAEPGFRLCLTALMYLLRVDPALLGPGISPLELPGGATFFRGHHGLPSGPLEERFGRDAAGFLAAGKKLGGETRPAGDAAVALEVFPGLVVEAILWQADDEFPAQVSFTLPARLDRFWFLDAVWGLLNLVSQELLLAAAGESS
ncbi:MAG: hypothetical protein A2139_07145 [Desulfobacca sp. RBG_16_60_12]|nr:MAG: hypothetical protein A2139_07145 [Desulfobacca sp. RBG_16_60_12]